MLPQVGLITLPMRLLPSFSNEKRTYKITTVLKETEIIVVCVICHSSSHVPRAGPGDVMCAGDSWVLFAVKYWPVRLSK